MSAGRTDSEPQRGRLAVPVSALAIIAVLLAVSASRRQAAETDDSLVVYCAHDAVFSEKILRQFERDTGIRVRIRFDEEANKSLGLVNQLLAERDNPRCDVFWNNQLLNTLQLKAAGVLASYKGPGYSRIPEQYRDPEGEWTGFAGRLRVYIVNTDEMQCDAETIARRLEGDLGAVAIAKPLFGTTRSHYAVLWEDRGPEATKAWHRSLHARNIREVQGNSTVRNLVAEGVCDFGFTDTDDFYGAADRGLPVEMLPIRVSGGRTICIPNTVSIVRGTKRRKQAERLVDYLLSAELEVRLANSPARQIPLGPVDQDLVPEEVRRIAVWAADSYDLRQAAGSQSQCLEWLKAEYLQ